MKKILTIVIGMTAIAVVAASCKSSGNNGGEAEVKDTATTEIYTLSLHDALPI